MSSFNSAAVLYALGAAGAGVALAVQAAANGQFRGRLGDNPLWATFFSVCGTILFASAAMLVIRPAPPAMDAVRSTVWWHWVGGPLGTVVVLSGALLAPRLGAANYAALVVGGQLLAAMLLDNYALMGLPGQALTAGRALGAVLIVCGVLCIKYL